MPDASKRDNEVIPFTQDINDYFENEIVPFKKDAWIDETKTKIGYEIPFTRLFFDFRECESSELLSSRISEREQRLMKNLKSLFSEGV